MSNPSVSDHAVERYIARVKPALGESQAREEIRALAELGDLSARPPRWARPVAHRHRQQGQRYLIATEDICFTVKKGRVLTTCLTKEGA